MNTRKGILKALFSGILLLAATLCCMAWQQAAISTPSKQSAPDASQRGNDTFIFVSDTQAPLFAETIIHKTPFNATATRMIFGDIVSRKPQYVFLLGDVVAAGSRPKRWQPVDRFLDSIRSNGGQVWACLGNHEYIYNARNGTGAFQKRFPDHRKTGYYVIKDSVAVILLNSNFLKLTRAEADTQQQFYEAALRRLDHTDSVKAVIVACHHSPYSNSRVVGSNLQVRERFAVPFQKSKKGMLFLSGHSHNFEHFRIEGKTFLVIGGGGGISQKLNTGINRIVCEEDGCHPLFHYLLVTRAQDRLWVICRQVNDDLKGFTDELHLELRSN